MSDLPDFLGIGAQKAGTSWLHENLRWHPDAFLPTLKELHYFDDRFDQPIEIYKKYFLEAANRKKGEITPAYSILPIERIQEIRNLMPDVRLILLLRNPIDRAWSHAQMILMTHTSRQFADVRPSEFIEQFQSDASLARGDYETVIARWLSVFPPSQLLIGFFEDITLRPVELLTDVFRHIGVRENVEFRKFPYSRKVYAGPGSPLSDEHRAILRKIYQPSIERLARRLGPRVGRWLDSI